jgi:hypothetical protein
MSRTLDLFRHSPRRELFRRIHRYAHDYEASCRARGAGDTKRLQQIRSDLAAFAAIIGDHIHPLDDPPGLDDPRPPNTQPLMPPGTEAEGIAILQQLIGDEE